MSYPKCDTAIYQTRTSRTVNKLGDAAFHGFNQGFLLEALCGYNIDAPEQLPSGSMKSYGKTDPFMLPSIHSREDDSVNQAYHDSVAKKLIAQVLADLEAERNKL